jgi:hypothetical protein
MIFLLVFLETILEPNIFLTQNSNIGFQEEILIQNYKWYDVIS